MAPPSRGATRCLLLLNGAQLLVAVACLSASLTIDAAGPVGRSAQALAAWAAALAAGSSCWAAPAPRRARGTCTSTS